VTYEVLAMGWDVADIWGSISLDLAVPYTLNPKHLPPDPKFQIL